MNVEEVLERVRELANWSPQALRAHLAGFGCDEPPKIREIVARTAGMSRGDLIVAIIELENES